jgi:hypothetical protein
MAIFLYRTPISIDNVNTLFRMAGMNIHFEKNGVAFVWNDRKAVANIHKHDGITFEQATEAFFDPFFKLVDAGRQDEARDAVIGYDESGRLLFVVHIEAEAEFIRLISARKATLTERNDYDF